MLAALGAAMAAVCVSLLCWLPDASMTGRASSAVRAGLFAFLVAHHGGATVDGVGMTFVPLGMTLIVAVIAWRSGSSLAGTLDRPGRLGGRALTRLVLLQAASYAAICGVCTVFSSLGSSQLSLLTTVPAAFLLFALAGGAGFARHSMLGTLIIRRVPAEVLAAIRPAAAGVATYVAGGALLAAGSLLLHAGTVTGISRQVGGGLSGIPVLLLGALSTPNAALGGTAYLAGPGFAVGAGASFSPFAAAHGLEPAFPILGALPGERAGTVLLIVLALAQLGAGLAVARLCWRSAAGLLTALRTAGLAAVLVAFVLGVASWLAGGSLGSGRMHTVGASPWQVTVALALELAVTSSAAITLTWVERWLRQRGDQLAGVSGADDPADVEAATGNTDK